MYLATRKRKKRRSVYQGNDNTREKIISLSQNKVFEQPDFFIFKHNFL